MSAFSRRTPSDPQATPEAGRTAASVVALHRFAIVAAAATFVLVFAGGLVTSTGSAMAVPSWPLDAGHLIPQQWGAGVLFEWGHRVIAGTVSILTLTLALWVWMAERRAWVRYTALAAFAMVVVQAVLGGITVLLDLPLALAVAHAMTGQAFFCLMVAIALFTSPRWQTMAPVAYVPGRSPLAPLAAATTAIIYLQIIVGALMRHMHAGLAIPDFPLNFGHLVPPMFSLPIAVNFAHRCGAVVVTAMVLWTVARTLRQYGDDPALRRPALGLLVLLAAQISLGAATVLSRRAVIPTTSHVAVGAAVLATCVALTLRAWNLERAARARAVSEGAQARAPRLGAAAARHEVGA
ncbi:MAG TPA: COX15/CtaA family protein [Candidatus Binataceae bacterium]|nr:COX15/CtaA family protein [Candidatus Binataceae bacterium]